MASNNLINNSTPNSPCKDCERRYIGCHSECEDYIEYKRKSAEAIKQVLDKKAFEALFYAQRKKVCTRVLKQKKNKG